MGHLTTRDAYKNLVFDNQAFANHRALAAVFGSILNLPPIKQALASKQFKSVYLDHLLSSHKKGGRNKKDDNKQGAGNE